MLIGEYTHSLDAKGRVSIPAKFRAELGSSAIVTKGLDSCLFVYPKGEWEIMAQKIAHPRLSSKSALAFSRLILSGAMEVEIDKLGRALLPGYLRDYAEIDGETVIAGVYNRLEIWDKHRWLEYSREAEKNSAAIAEQLTDWEL